MIKDLPNTSTSAISSELLALRSEGGAVALGRVLTLLVAVEPAGLEDAIAAAIDATNDHPARILAVCPGEGEDVDVHLDASIRVGGDAGTGEVIVLRPTGEMVNHPDALVTPFLLPDAPIVAWWPGEPPPSPKEHPLGAIASRRITDMARTPAGLDPIWTMAAAYSPGDTDLAWTRLTFWRRVLASVLDDIAAGPAHAMPQITAVSLTAADDSPSATLLGAWLARCLQVPVTRQAISQGGGITGVTLSVAEGGEITLERDSEGVLTLARPNAPARRLRMPPRSDAECLDEELCRLDPDPVYHDVLTAAAR